MAGGSRRRFRERQQPLLQRWSGKHGFTRDERGAETSKANGGSILPSEVPLSGTVRPLRIGRLNRQRNIDVLWSGPCHHTCPQ